MAGRNIYLPDESGGLIRPTCVVFDTVRNKVYYGGGTDSLADSTDPNELEFWIVVANAATLERVAHVRAPNRVAGLCFNPASGRIYCALAGSTMKCNTLDGERKGAVLSGYAQGIPTSVTRRASQDTGDSTSPVNTARGSGIRRAA